jgi:hypothetical protein
VIFSSFFPRFFVMGISHSAECDRGLCPLDFHHLLKKVDENFRFFFFVQVDPTVFLKEYFDIVPLITSFILLYTTLGEILLFFKQYDMIKKRKFVFKKEKLQ